MLDQGVHVLDYPVKPDNDVGFKVRTEGALSSGRKGESDGTQMDCRSGFYGYDGGIVALSEYCCWCREECGGLGRRL